MINKTSDPKDFTESQKPTKGKRPKRMTKKLLPNLGNKVKPTPKAKVGTSVMHKGKKIYG